MTSRPIRFASPRAHSSSTCPATTIPHLGWSKDGRRLICRTNTGYSIASIDVATQHVTAPLELPIDIDFAWWDRRLIAR